MSVNQISPEFLWWAPSHQQKMNSAHNSNILFAHHFQNSNHDDDDDQPGSNRPVEEGNNYGGLQMMFEKPLTPSDVGKLNRLVIPKQHAERHFPLNTSNGAESGGMLLTFEDEIGKLWRFRYSYWNSSQSYVLTKGWSRYVKEKRLDAGDVVFFQRHPTDQDRLFIGWRRRQDSTGAAAAPPAAGGRGFYPEASAGADHIRGASFNGSSSSRTLRLFGVNMEYQFESDQSEPATPDGSSTSSPSGQHYSQFYPQAASYGMNSYNMQQYRG